MNSNSKKAVEACGTSLYIKRTYGSKSSQSLPFLVTTFWNIIFRVWLKLSTSRWQREWQGQVELGPLTLGRTQRIDSLLKFLCSVSTSLLGYSQANTSTSSAAIWYKLLTNWMAQACVKAKNMCDIKPWVYTCVKWMNHKGTYLYEVSATKWSSLQPVASALNLIIYTCRTILDGMVIKILG